MRETETMPGHLQEIAFDGPLSARLAGSPSPELAIYWLGRSRDVRAVEYFEKVLAAR